MNGTASSLKKLSIPHRKLPEQQFCQWFVGFFDGEGSLGVGVYPRGNHAQLTLAVGIALRIDDLSVLQYIQQHLGGRLTFRQRTKGNERNQAVWVINRVEDLAELILPLFDKYQLQTKKAAEYGIWRTLVIHRYFYLTRFRRQGGYRQSEARILFFKRRRDAIRKIRHMEAAS